MHHSLKRSVLAVLITAMPALVQAREGFTNKNITGTKESAALADIAALPFTAQFSCFQSQSELLATMDKVVTTANNALAPFKGKDGLADIIVTDRSIAPNANVLEDKEFQVPQRDKDGKEIFDNEKKEPLMTTRTVKVPVEGCDNSWSGTLGYALLTQTLANNALGKAEQAVTSALVDAKLLAPKANADRRNRVAATTGKIGYWLSDGGRRKIEDEITRPGAWADMWAKFEFYKNTEKDSFAEAYVASVGETFKVIPRRNAAAASRGLESAQDVAPAMAFSSPSPAGAPSVAAVEVGLGTIRVQSTINVGWNVRLKTNRLSPRG